MNNKISKFEYFFTTLLFIAVIVGFFSAYSKRITKGTGSINTENYKDFFDINVVKEHGYGNTAEYTVSYTVYLDTKYYIITDLSITYRLESLNSNLSTCTKVVNLIDTKSHFIIDTGMAKYTDLDIISSINSDDIRIYVESVTGKYHYNY